MRCDEFEYRLHELLDRRVAPDDDAALCSHADGCAECAEMMSLYVAMTGAIRVLPKSEPPVSLPFEVLHRIDQGQAQHATVQYAAIQHATVQHVAERRAGWLHRQSQHCRWQNGRWQRAAATILASAAGLLIGLALWNSRPSGEPIATGDDAPVVVASASTAVFDYDKFAEETQQFADYITARQYQMMIELAEGMRPVAFSCGAALETLRSSLPYAVASARTTSS